tara:strand:- start:14177 stop:17524 length:3348 start_codon:yes stop_codon:yes gene_type:complete
MESVVFRYSDFFNDDGGFDKIRREFDDLGDDLIKKAKEVREKTKLFDVDQSEGIKEAETQAEALTEAFEKYGQAKEDINKIEKEFLKTKKKENQSTDDQIDSLVKLDKKLQGYRDALKEIQVFQKNGIKTGRDLNKERVEAELNIKKVNKEIRKQQSEILKSNELSKKEQKLLKAKLVLDKENVSTIDDVRERISALRTVVQTLDLDEQADEIARFNSEIDDLTETLDSNSDKFIQSKINIGNYEESITNALKGSQAFKTNIAGLDSVLESVLGSLLLTREELDTMENSADANTNAIKRMSIAFGKLNKVLKASIIGVVLVAIGALASAFGDTRAGAVRLEKVMATLSNAFTTFGKASFVLFGGIADGFSILFDSIKKLSEFSLKDIFTGDFKFSDLLGDPAKQFANIKDTFAEVIDIVKNGSDAVVEGLENIDRAYKIEDNIRRLNQEIAILTGSLNIAQLQAGDATKSLTFQLEANAEALRLTEEIAEKQLSIANQQLELANEKVKQNIKANGVESSNINLGLKGEAFAKATLDLAQKRGVELEISNDLIADQQKALEDVIAVENELQVTREDNSKLQREINRDIFEQNLDLLIDLIDTEKNISEQFVNDTTRNFQSRINEFNRFLIAFRTTAQKELDEFTKEASNLGLDLDFSIQYDENGDFDVFIGDTQLATDNIVELNKQLQGFGLNEIDINRFREFIIEGRNGIRDFKELNKELVLAGINLKEISKNVIVSEGELEALDSLQIKINKLIETQRLATSEKERDVITKQLIELEKKKDAITEFADEERLNNRKTAIDEELKTVEEGSSRYYELLQERIDLEKQIREKGIDSTLKKTKEANQKALDDYKQFANDVRNVLDSVVDKVLETNQTRIDESKKAVDKQGELIDIQRQRAEAGLENTLAFEQRELGKREAELIKRQKRQEKLEKVKALYSSYNNYSSRGEENAISKALRDFAILEAISASFKDGGITGVDGVKTNRHGVTIGKKHNANGLGGNLAWHEKGEGFFPKVAVDNMGHSNFYKLKEMALNGNIDSNFFSGQRKEFIQQTNMVISDPELTSEMRQVRKAVENKPVSQWDVANITQGTIDVVETVIRKNAVKRNHFRIKKPRL